MWFPSALNALLFDGDNFMAQFRKVQKPNEASAHYFMNQCIGSTNGHMAKIPNNPNINTFMGSHGVGNRETFVEFLEGVIEQLKKE